MLIQQKITEKAYLQMLFSKKKWVKIERLETKIWKRLMLYQTLGHFDIWYWIVYITNSLHVQNLLNKWQFCSHISTTFNCLPLIRLTEIADDETRACFNNTHGAYHGGLLEPHFAVCLRPRPALIRCIFERAAVSPGTGGLCPLGVDAGSVRGIWPLRCPWSRECLHD